MNLNIQNTICNLIKELLGKYCNKKPDINYSEIEKEIIYLNATMEFIDALVNYDNFNFSPASGEKEVQFKTPEHMDYFSIILVDFLSRSDKGITGDKDVSYLKALRRICKNPSFKGCSTDSLSASLDIFSDWIKKEVTFQNTWLSSIETELNLKISRYEMFKICGNMTKHNVTGLSYMANLLMTILRRNNVPVEIDDVLCMFDDFYERFHEHIHVCYAGIICEMLNNIRLGLFEYLMPEYKRSYIDEGWDDELRFNRHSFDVPDIIKNKFVKQSYWALMTKMKSGPFMERFRARRFPCE